MLFNFQTRDAFYKVWLDLYTVTHRRSELRDNHVHQSRRLLLTKLEMSVRRSLRQVGFLQSISIIHQRSKHFHLKFLQTSCRSPASVRYLQQEGVVMDDNQVRRNSRHQLYGLARHFVMRLAYNQYQRLLSVSPSTERQTKSHGQDGPSAPI